MKRLYLLGFFTAYLKEEPYKVISLFFKYDLSYNGFQQRIGY